MSEIIAVWTSDILCLEWREKVFVQRRTGNDKKCLTSIISKGLKNKFQWSYSSNILHKKKIQCVSQKAVLIMKLSGHSSPQIPPGLSPRANGKSTFQQCHLQILNWIVYSCTYGLYPFFITLKRFDIQILFQKGTFAFRKGLIACIEIWIVNIEKNIIKGSCL